jgi:hypothetical protein
MTRFDLPENFIEDPKALIRRTRAKLKKVRVSSSQLKAPSESEDHQSIFRSLTLEFEAMANKSLREFSALTTDNIRTGPTEDIDRPFELKHVLINMV